MLRKSICSIFALTLILTLSGCAAQSAALHYNPVTNDVGVEVVFKDGRWIKQPRALIATGPCQTETRAVVDPCVTSGTGRAVTYAQRGTVTESNIRAAITGESPKGVRSIAGPLVSQRSLARAVAKTAKEVREEEKDTARALKEIHDAEIRRVDKIIHATNPSMKSQFRRFFGGGSSQPDPETPSIVIPSNQ